MTSSIETEYKQGDRWTVDQEAKAYGPRYRALSRAMVRAYASGGIDALLQVYREAEQPLYDMQIDLATKVVQRNVGTAPEAFREDASSRYNRPCVLDTDGTPLAAAAGDEAPLTPSLSLGAPGLPVAEDLIESVMTLPDGYGETLSSRIWRNTRSTRDDLTTYLRSFTRQYSDFREATNALTTMQLNDTRLPQHMQNLERSARRVFQYMPEAKKDFLSTLRDARHYVEGLTPGDRGTRGFQRRVLQKFNKAVREGSEAGVEEAMTRFIERRARYRAQVLLRSAGQRAFQESSLNTFAKYDFVQAVSWNLSPAHQHFDECDLKAQADMGLGRGVYYVSHVPWPDHPNGTCWLGPVMSSIRSVDTAEKFRPVNPASAAEAVARLRGPLAKEANKLGRRAKGIKQGERKSLLDQVPTVPQER